MREIPFIIELPPTNTRRWVARRKAAVVAAVSGGMITLEEACRRYRMSEGSSSPGAARSCAIDLIAIAGPAIDKCFTIACIINVE